MTLTNTKGKVVVAGITNLETRVRIENFPLDYAKSRFAFDGITDRPGGVGYNVASSLAGLGTSVELATMLGDDVVGAVLKQSLSNIPNLGQSGILQNQPATLRSCILVDEGGEAAMITDLKNAQDVAYPLDQFALLLDRASLVHASNINWAYDLAVEARCRGIKVSTDVQDISQLDDAYNRRFLEVADLVFFSAENLEDDPQDFIRQLQLAVKPDSIICTMAGEGVLFSEVGSGAITHQPVPKLNGPIVNVTGAGDTFVAGVLSGLVQKMPLETAVMQGQLVAGYKIRQSDEGHRLPSRDWLNDQLN
jgi:ribokinase